MKFILYICPFSISTRLLVMCPKGDMNGAEHFSLFLNACDYVTNGPKGPTLAVFKMRVLDQLKRNHYEKGIYSKFLLFSLRFS